MSNTTDRETRKGLVLVNTGTGKGKTTAALGVVFRAWGHGLRPCVIQFIKSQKGRWGEVLAAEKLGIEWHTLGAGFVFDASPDSPGADCAREAWKLAQAKIAGGSYDLIILDEFTYPLKFGWLDTDAVITWLAENKPPELHIIITGRDAPDALCEFADLVTDMQVVKHPFSEGIRGQRGIEF